MNICLSRISRCAKLSLCLLCLLCLVLIAPGWAATSEAGKRNLLDKIEQADESISVIVTFNDLVPAAMLAAKEIKTVKRLQNSGPGIHRIQSEIFNSGLKTRQNGLKAKLLAKARGKYKYQREYTHFPMLALSVNRSALQLLLDDPAISIAENVLKRPFLSSSVPNVFPSLASSPYDGDNKWVVAILDTGVDKSHSFLAGKVVSEACYSDEGDATDSNITASLCPGGEGNPSSIAVGSGVHCDATTISGCDHGTHVAGVAVGDGGSFNGVAEQGNIISIQIYSSLADSDACLLSGAAAAPCAVSYLSDMIAGLDRILALSSTYDIAAVNLSLGSGSHSGDCNDVVPESLAINALKAAGIATIAAAGNASLTSTLPSPACISSAIAVGSTSDVDDTASSDSNFSGQLDLYAPGENINSSVPEDGFAVKTGTSFSAPHVAGAWAVIKHAAPNLTVDQIEALFKSHGPEVISPDFKDKPTVPEDQKRRRLDVTEVLASDEISPPEDDGGMMFPILTRDGKIAIIAL